MQARFNSRSMDLKILQAFSSHLKGKRVLVAVSGGLDSTLMLEALVRLQKKVEFQIVIAHVFHGPESTGFRRKAFEFVRGSFSKHFVSNIKDPSTTSRFDDLGFTFPAQDEESLRHFRVQVLRQLKLLTEADFIAVGHHRDDLLETRLIRLIRGTGREGLKSMSAKSKNVIRPLLSFWKHDLVTVAEELSLVHLNDPTNQDSRYLRNWLRHSWLPKLEAHRPGASRALARSLEQLVVHSQAELARLRSLILSEGVDRLGLLTLSYVEQRQVLASYLKQKHVKNYSASHVDEVLKRLRSNKKSFDFRVAGRVWKISSDLVEIAEIQPKS